MKLKIQFSYLFSVYSTYSFYISLESEEPLLTDSSIWFSSGLEPQENKCCTLLSFLSFSLENIQTKHAENALSFNCCLWTRVTKGWLWAWQTKFLVYNLISVCKQSSHHSARHNPQWHICSVSDLICYLVNFWLFFFQMSVALVNFRESFKRKKLHGLFSLVCISVKGSIMLNYTTSYVSNPSSILD